MEVHVIIYNTWCARWPNCLQVVCLRGLSDHCPLVCRLMIIIGGRSRYGCWNVGCNTPFSQLKNFFKKI